MCVEVLAELSDTHHFSRLKIDSLNQDSVFNILNFLLNIVRVLNHTRLNLFEVIDAFITLADELINREGEPVVVFTAFLHKFVQFVDVLFEEGALNSVEVRKS